MTDEDTSLPAERGPTPGRAVALRLAAALLALVAGIAAVIVAILVVRSALG